jgi:pimeloyl-ACP methyl ester carboxylesterase
MAPETRYARSGDVNIAYQVVGDGPRDLVVIPGWVSNIDLFWEEPNVARFFERLASFSRLILFDKRGTGLSDRVAAIPNLETRMDDVRAVMDAVSSTQAALYGYSEGGPMCALFAATYPERMTALIMGGSYARADVGSGLPMGNAAGYLGGLPRRSGSQLGRDRRPR